MRELRSQKIVKKRRKRLLLRVSLFVAIMCVIVGIPILLARISKLQINSVLIKGNETISTDVITNVVNDKLSGNYYFVFPRSNVALYPQKLIEQSIRSEFPKVLSVKVSLSNFHTIEVSLTERKTVAIWCNGSDMADCYSVDKDGYVFDHAPLVSGSVYYIYRGYISGDPIGQTYLSLGQFSKIETFIDRVRALGLETNELDALSDDQYQLVAKGGGIILFVFENNGEKVISNLGSILDDKTIRVMENGILNVSTIDLRHGNKVILKKKGV